MTDKPIIFSAPMVRALLDGRKTQTRRVLKGDPFQKIAVDEAWWCPDRTEWRWQGDDMEGWVPLPYAVGDRLYVREAFRPHGLETPISECSDLDDIMFRADANEAEDAVLDWKPSIHMPRWASRITLTVTDVRVQRLQDISEADAVAEGVAAITKDGKLVKHGIPDRDGLPGNDDHGWHWSEWEADPRAAFRRLWNSLHGSEAWNANPWVAAYSFTVQMGNIDQLTKVAA